MSRNDIIMGIVALVLVIFSLVVSLVVPRRNPGFPGRNVKLFVVVAASLVAGMLATVEVVGSSEKQGAEAAVAEPAAPQPAPPVASEPTQPAASAPAPPAAQPAGDPAAGKKVFASAGCTSCHTLADAGAKGTVGPSLDDAKPPYDRVVDRVTNGKGAMPAFGKQGLLNQQQIQDVAAYVVKATSG